VYASLEKEASDTMKPMRPASIVLALVVMLSIVGKAGAQTPGWSTDVPNDSSTLGPYIEAPVAPTTDYTLAVGKQRFGFREWAFGGPPRSTVCCGPIGSCQVPFTAAQCLIGSGIVAFGLFFALPFAFTFRWIKKRTA
jgi:hypothetical protein